MDLEVICQLATTEMITERGVALPHLFRLPSTEQAMQPKTEKYSYGNEQTVGLETVRVYLRMPIYFINNIFD